MGRKKYEDIDDLKPYYGIKVSKKGALRAYNGVWAVLYILWGLLFIFAFNLDFAWAFFWLVGVALFVLFGPLRIMGFVTDSDEEEESEVDDRETRKIQSENAKNQALLEKMQIAKGLKELGIEPIGYEGGEIIYAKPKTEEPKPKPKAKKRIVVEEVEEVEENVPEPEPEPVAVPPKKDPYKS